MKDQLINWLQAFAVFEMLVIGLLGLIIRNLVEQLHVSGTMGHGPDVVEVDARRFTK